MVPDQTVGIFSDKGHHPGFIDKSSGQPQNRLSEEITNVKGIPGLPYKQKVGSLDEGKTFISGIPTISQGIMLENHESLAGGLPPVEGDLRVTAPRAHQLFSSTGLDTVRFGDAFMDIANERLKNSSSKVPDNVSLKHPPAPRVTSSLAGLSEFIDDTIIRGESPSPASTADGNLESSTRKDGQFHRTPSCSDADVLETSFSEVVLKSSSKKANPQESSNAHAEAADAGTRSNKKGKKGRHIDPALPGFKVLAIES